jgi:hypothetical protein
MRVGKAGLSLALVAAAILAGTSALEASGRTPSGAKVELFSNPTTSGAGGSMLIAGAIGDHGTYAQVDRNGTPDPNGSYVKIILRNGTIEVRFTAATIRHKTAFMATCSGVFSERTPSVVLGGTGQYAGISGTLEFTATHVLLSSRHTTGPDAEQCNHTHIIAEYNSVGASGTVRLS